MYIKNILANFTGDTLSILRYGQDRQIGSLEPEGNPMVHPYVAYPMGMLIINKMDKTKK